MTATHLAHLGHVATLWPGFSTLLALTATLSVAAWLTRRIRPVGSRALVVVAIGALSFQVFHGIEHIFQFGYWVLHPDEGPWMSEWAMLGMDALSALLDRPPPVGNELLHLIGNAIFMTGLVAGAPVLFGSVMPAAWRWALRCQAIHLGEHVVLSATSLMIGRSIGATTMLGTLEPTSTTGVAVRVCSHFVLNAIPTLLGAYSILGARRQPDRPDVDPPRIAVGFGVGADRV